jgi:hypothetical protein
VSERSALHQHSGKTRCPGIANLIAAEIEVSQRWAPPQNSCEPLCILSFHFTARQLKCGDAATDCQSVELPHDEFELFSGCSILGVVPEAPTQAHNGRHAHLVHCLFDSL